MSNRRTAEIKSKDEQQEVESFNFSVSFFILRFKIFYACMQTQELQLIENLKLMTFPTLGGRSKNQPIHIESEAFKS